MTLIQELGRDYFNEMCAAALFLHDNEVCRVDFARSGTVHGYRYNNDEDNPETRIEIPEAYFSGWKVFEYPRLGYRRVADNTVAHFTRQQSTRRGLRLESVNIQLTPLSTLLHNLGLVRAPQPRQRALAIMKPRFDDFNRDLPRLLDGELSALVLSDTLLIEADTGQKSDHFNIYLRQHAIGRMDKRGSIEWEDPNMSKFFNQYQVTTNG